MPDGATPQVLGPGDSFILRPGSRATQDVIATTRNDHVM